MRPAFPLLWTLLLGLVSAAGCGNAPDTAAQAENENARITNVSVSLLRPDSLTQFAQLPVTALPWRDVTLSFTEGGEIEEILKDLGDRVQAGDLLARQNTDLLDAAAIEAEAEFKLHTYNFERTKRLYEDGSVSEQDYIAAGYNLKRAESRVQTIRYRLQHARLLAPFAGKIAARTVELGQVVSPGAPIFRLVQTHPLKLEAWVPENQIADFSEGGRVHIGFHALPGRDFEGAIGRIGPAAQSGSRVFPIEVRLPNPDGLIRPGMIGKLKAVRRTYDNVIVIPRQAVLERETGPAAFILENTTARLRQLSLGPSEGDRVVVREGLAPGDRLIILGARDLIDGDRVRVTEAEE